MKIPTNNPTRSHPRRRHLFVLGALLCSAFALSASAVTITVVNTNDSGAGSLRAAIAGASNGDTINFAVNVPGQITLASLLTVNKSVTITGPGANLLAISGNDAVGVIYVPGGLGLQVTIESLTITHGSQAFAGGIYNEGATLTLSNCVISNNNATGSDGGGFTNSGVSTLINCTVTGNSARFSGGGIENGGTLFVIGGSVSGNYGGAGGGISNDGTLTLTNCTLSGNSADAEGGGIFNNSTLTLTNCTLSGNSVGDDGEDGGGIYANQGMVTLTDCTLSGNSAGDGQGGAIRINLGMVTLTGCTLSGNSAGDGQGGAIYIGGGMATLTDCTLSGNSADNEGGGGGIFNFNTLTLTNCTLSGNHSNGFTNDGGGGIENYGTTTLTNCTLSGNSAASSRYGGGGILNYEGSVILVNSIVANSTSGDIVNDGATTSASFSLIGDGSGGVTNTSGNLVGTAGSPLNPQLGPLQNNGGPTFTMAPISNSPVLGVGSVLLAVDGNGDALTTDQRGLSRVVNGFIDMGAVETGGVPVFGNGNVTVVTGSAPIDLTNASGASPAGGTFTSPGLDLSSGTFDPTGLALGVYTITYTVSDGQGGTISSTFTATVAEQPSLVVTTTSDVVSATDRQTSLREAIAYAKQLGGTQTITFNNGSVPGAAVNFYDGNQHTIVLNGNQLQVLTDVTIHGPGANVLTVSGNNESRVFQIGDLSFTSPLRITVAVEGMTIANGNGNDGGGIILGFGDTLSIDRCTISHNQSDAGGGIYSFGILTITNSTVSDNVSNNEGGGIRHFNNGTLTLVNSTVSNNFAEGGSPGGGLDVGGPAFIINSTISNNVSGDVGGGIYVDTSGGVTCANSIISGNNPGNAFDGDVFGNFTSKGYNLIGNTNNSSGWAATDIQNPFQGAMLSSLGNYGGPTQTMVPLPGSSVIGAGNPALALDQHGQPLITDQRGLARTINNMVDMGAVEAAATILTGPATTPSFGQSLVITASVANATGGKVDFYLNGATTPSATMPLLANSTATATFPSLSAGGYNVTAVYTDGGSSPEGNSNTLAQSVNKASATVTVTPYSLNYDGNSHSATGTATGAKGETLGGLSLTGTAHTNAGSYNDTWTFTDATGNYSNTTGSVNDVIGKGTATVKVTPYSLNYDGNPHSATGTAAGVKGETLAGLSLTSTAHTNAGNYNDTWTFTDATGNYNNATGSVNDAINKANASVKVVPYSVTYDANSHSATGTATGIKGETLSGLSLTGTAHTNAGPYANDPWTFTDTTGNYNNSNGTVSDAIGNATLTITANNLTRPFEQANPTLTVGYAGFQGNDTLANSVTGSPGLSTTATPTSQVGTYPITVNTSAMTSANYTLKPVNGTLTVGFGVGIVGLNSVKINGGPVVDSFNSSLGAYSSSKSNSAELLSNGTIDLQGTQMGGDVVSSIANLIIESGTVVTGNALYSTTLTNQGTINGQKLKQTETAFSAPVPASFSTYTAAPTSSNNWITGAFSYDPKQGNLNISGGNVATLTAGTYYFQNVQLSGGATLKISGPVVIHVAGTFQNSGGSMTSSTLPGNLQIISSFTGNNGVQFSGGATVYLAVYAPGTDVQVSGNTVIYGTLVGKTLSMSGNSVLHYDLALGNIFSTMTANPSSAKHGRK